MVVVLVSALSCSIASVPPPSTEPRVEAPVEIHAVAFSRDGKALFYAIGSSRCEIRSVDVGSRDDKLVVSLSFCPGRLATLDDGSVLATSSDQSAWISADGTIVNEGRLVSAAVDPSHLLERTDAGLVWRTDGASVQLEVSRLRTPVIASGGVLLAIQSGTEGERLVRFDGPGPTAITPWFEAIDSWDVAPRGEEVVFSAKVDSGFDVGIVSSTGGEIRWVAPDPADERHVTWAPRGSKITYTFESLDATLVRSVHVPTSFQVIFDLPLTSVRQIAWEPRAERFAIVIESPTMGPRIDWVGYQGEEPDTLVASRERVESPVEALYWEGGSGVLLGPGILRYGEEMGTVVWIVPGDPFAWRPEVSRLRSEGVPIVITTSSAIAQLGGALADLPWFNASRAYVVDASGAAGSSAGAFKQATWITMEGSEAPDRAVVLPGSGSRFRALAVDHVLRLEETRR